MKQQRNNNGANKQARADFAEKLEALRVPLDELNQTGKTLGLPRHVITATPSRETVKAARLHRQGMNILLDHLPNDGHGLWGAVQGAGVVGLGAVMIRQRWGISARNLAETLTYLGHNVRLEGKGRGQRVVAVE